MTPEDSILYTAFDLELRKLAFPQALVQAGQRAMQAGQRGLRSAQPGGGAYGAVAGINRAVGSGLESVVHGAGRVGSEVLSGIPARMNIRGMQRSREQLLAQLERLEQMARTAKPPTKGFFQGSGTHQKALDEWSAAQEALGARRQMLKQQLPVFEDEARRLAEHLEQLKQAPWTTPL
jgi:hypothetical protein